MPCLLFALIASAAALPPVVVERVKFGTVLIRVEGGEGSGFFLRDELVVSNAHVVGPPGTHARVVLDSGTRGGKTVWGTVVAEDAERDLALLHVPGHPGRALSLVTDAGTRETMEVVAVGFPRGSERALVGVSVDPPVSLRPGAVTSLYRDDAAALLMIEHNANMQQGNSGGPLVDAQGQVVGVNVAVLRTDETTKLAVPVGVLSAWVAALSREERAPAAPAAPARPQRTSERFAMVFEAGAVRDLASGADGQHYVLGMDGSLFRIDAEGTWTEFGANDAVTSVGVDLARQTLYVTTSVGPALWRYVPADGWTELRKDDYVSVAAHAGDVWAVHRSGTVHARLGGEWRDLGLEGVREVTACRGAALVRSSTQLTALRGGSDLAEARVDGVRDFSCAGERGYLLDDGGVLRGFPDGKTVDADPANVRVFATPRGAMLLSKGADGLALWWRANDGSTWARVR